MMSVPGRKVSCGFRATKFTNRLAVLAAIFMATHLGSHPARSEITCPAGQFLSSHEDRCSTLSRSSRLPTDDTAPMVFQIVHDSPTLAIVQATGTIIPDTPAHFAKFLKSDEAKLLATSGNYMNLHSRGGDPAAGIRLGEMIRKARFSTGIGRSLPLSEPGDNYSYDTAVCLGACALAFLGGVERAYHDKDTYGFAGLITPALPGLASYLKRMGVKPTMLRDMLKAERIPQAAAQLLRITIRSDTASLFHADSFNGRPVAWFQFYLRNDTYRGMVSCENKTILLGIINLDGPIPAALHVLKETPVKFQDNASNIVPATATYVRDASTEPDMLQFKLPGLKADSFADDGLRLWMIARPGYDGIWGDIAPYGNAVDQSAWDDVVTAFSFVIHSRNAVDVLPAVLKDCNGP
jgi:hypothetical protein